MTHGSLFSGVGGFDLAAQWMNWENVFHCEINPFGQKILKYYWPESISYHDIKTTDFSIHRGSIDVLSGGFPCQPYSSAGKRLGKEDDRHLWPEMLRAIREISPRWIVGENVRGLTNWNGGVVFDEVQADLEAEGYQVLPFLLPACAVNAPHRRDRIWFIAHSSGKRSTASKNDEGEREVSQYVEEGRGLWSDFKSTFNRKSTTYSDGKRMERISDGGCDDKEGRQVEGRQHCESSSNDWINFPTVAPVRSGDDGFPTELDGITIPNHANESIKGYGNAVVPGLVHQLFKAIEQYEALLNTSDTP